MRLSTKKNCFTKVSLSLNLVHSCALDLNILKEQHVHEGFVENLQDLLDISIQ